LKSVFVVAVRRLTSANMPSALSVCDSDAVVAEPMNCDGEADGLGSTLRSVPLNSVVELAWDPRERLPLRLSWSGPPRRATYAWGVGVAFGVADGAGLPVGTGTPETAALAAAPTSATMF
jgi:hypothetical protein